MIFYNYVSEFLQLSFQIESHVNYNLNISVRYKYFLDPEVTGKLDSLQQEVST